VGSRLAALCLLAALATAVSAADAQFTITLHGDITGTLGRGTVTSSPGNINCTIQDGDGGGPVLTGTCVGTFASGVVVTLTATPAANVTFNGWSAAPCGGTGANCVLTMTQSYTPTATFRPATSFQLTVTLQGNGYGNVKAVDFRGSPKISCVIAGQNQPQTCTSTYPATTTTKLEISSNLNAAGDVSFTSPCTGTALCILSMDGPRTVVATFRSPAIVVGSAGGNGSGRVTSSSGGIDCTIGTAASGTCFATYPGTSQPPIVLTAQAATGSTFAGWTVSDRTCPGTGTCTITAPAFFQPGTVVSARFTIPQNGIVVSGTGSGNIKSSPTGIDCNLTLNVAAGSCDVGFTPGATVTLTATPATGWQFSSWGAACAGKTTNTCDVQLTQDRQVTVTFTRTLMALTIAGGGNGDGNVASSSPSGIINCTVTGTNVGATGCSAQVAFETNVTLTATPAANSTFESWSLPTCTGTGPCVVPMTTPRTITATFRGTRVNVTVTGVGTGDGLVTAADGMSCRITKGVAASAGCLTSAVPGNNASLTAVPQFGSVFGGWSVTSCSATSLTCAVPVSGPMSVSARFTAPPPAAQLVDALLGSGPKLSADQETQLDKFGNNDGTFNLGDLIALLDRTNESVSAAALARIAEIEQQRPSRQSPRRGVP
jgi:hypothetical protein